MSFLSGLTWKTLVLTRRWSGWFKKNPFYFESVQFDLRSVILIYDLCMQNIRALKNWLESHQRSLICRTLRGYLQTHTSCTSPQGIPSDFILCIHGCCTDFRVPTSYSGRISLLSSGDSQRLSNGKIRTRSLCDNAVRILCSCTKLDITHGARSPNPYNKQHTHAIKYYRGIKPTATVEESVTSREPIVECRAPELEWRLF